jgi:hypothetical protein
VARAKTRGRGWQGEDVDDDSGRGNCVFALVVVVDFRGAMPTWGWGGRAVAGMLGHIALLRCVGGVEEKENGVLVLEGGGPNNQHTF